MSKVYQAVTPRQVTRLAQIERELRELDDKGKALEVEVTQIFATAGIAAKDMGDEVFDFVYNDPHDHKKLLKELGFSAPRAASETGAE